MEDKEKNKKSDAALREEQVLEFWKEKDIFQKSLNKNSPKGEFVFYDGPPTANGMPGIHHLIPQSFKDAIPRYKTMQGFHVRRKGGWDTHGLPVELLVEKELGLKSKKEIESYGIAEFNQKCKESVWKYVDAWYKYRDRVGYWVDKDNPYVTYHNMYIESVWNVVKKIQEKNLLYKDYKVVPWCPRCGTALSSHELAQGYEEVKDLSVYAKFKIVAKENTGPDAYFLAWTTTPWTLPGNVALAVGSDIDYVEVKTGSSEILVLAKSRLSILDSVTDSYEIIAEHKGAEMAGMQYEPLFPYLKEHIEKKGEPTDKMFKVYIADFVNTEDGTGIVHTAVMYGQDDFVLGTQVGLPKHHLVNPEGNFIKGTGFLEGRFVKETDRSIDGKTGKPTLAVDIIEDLKKRNLFFKQENYKHSYPHCWRCKTALIYYARDSWYIRMSEPGIKAEMIAQNKQINWEPGYIRDGRFGEWLREIKDWAISRERYWGTPLPVWQCTACNKVDVIGSMEDLKKKTKKSGNKYFVMRHGQSESNVKEGAHGVVSSRAENVDHLTAAGVEQVKETAKKLKEKNINFDLVFVSPFMRTWETLDILKENLGFKDEQIILDKRLGELDAGDFEGKPWDEYRRMFKNERERFLNPIHGGESILDVKRRMGDVFYELEEKYKDKTILVISHGAPLWMLYALLKGYNVDESIDMTGGVFRHREQIEQGTSPLFCLFANAEYRAVDFVYIPHNKDYELDLHRPFIDEVKLACAHSTDSGQACGGDLMRTPEVMDVWFDSGAMPFAQDHYPFDVLEPLYPADFISEAIDQTRGWFYTLHAVGVLMGRGKAYKNVICLGHLMDATGKKMSKSLGNIIEPFEMIEKYGVDTLRLWMYSVNQPGEPKNFDEKTVALIQSQVFGLLYNVLAFYELYRDKNLEKGEQPNFRPQSKNILDQWILARLDELTESMTKSMDSYKLLEPVRAVRDFIGDLSTWYLRRSRDRIKDGDAEAKQTLYFVLKTLAKLMAPFAPFTADDIWLKLKNENDAESAHLAPWPVKKARRMFSFRMFNSTPEVLEKMEAVRTIVTLGLEARQSAGIKVRQPLNNLWVIAESLPSRYIEIIKSELNIKNVIFLLKIKAGITKVTLDKTITPDLKQEGGYRELVRGLQDMRKKLGLTPSDMVAIAFETGDMGKKLIEKFESDMKKTVMVSKIDFKDNDGTEIKVDDLVFKVKIGKI
ncbi:MAG TPA: class I tRNA ligase family protein [Candidatus Paceibacterota bacterium]|jgi:isoleucyl-tRNA synthetase|nr:class I tRNA ligase family protein [Candidatus Paceibacterota bacterium]